jgi:DNA helicase-2/ATP-dependent DNA helicase PcrA
MKKLYLTRAERRRTFGSINYALPSRFLEDIPKENMECIVDHSRADRISFGQKRPSSGNPWETKPVAEPDFEWGQDYSDHFQFKKGEKVSHASFGQGVVQGVEFLGDDECLTIQFPSKGKKRVLSKFVQKLSA